MDGTEKKERILQLSELAQVSTTVESKEFYLNELLFELALGTEHEEAVMEAIRSYSQLKRESK